LQVRQTERAKLQNQLWQRAEGRASARTKAEAVAVLSQVVESTVSANGGLATAAPRTGEAKVLLLLLLLQRAGVCMSDLLQ
jgi:hypothetical protein